MKKFFAFLLTAAMLVTMFAVVTPAEDYSFEITGVDEAVGENGVVICTDLETWANCGPNWSNNVQLTEDGDGYRVVATYTCPGNELGDNPSADDLIDGSDFTENDGDIYVILHDGGSNPSAYSIGDGMTAEIDNLEVGATITFSGVALAGKKINVKNNIAFGCDYEHSELYRQGDAASKWAYD